MALTADDLDGFERTDVYEDGTLVRVSIRRTESDTYPSGWKYTLHYGELTPGPETLEDGTILRYDNSHEDTKGHERHEAPDTEPADIEFPGMIELYEQFWDEISKPRFEPSNGGDTNE